MPDQMQARVGVAEAIRHLRAELAAAQAEGSGKQLRFGLDRIELELSIDFTKAAEAGGGFKLFSFVDISAKGRAEEKSGHRLKLTMTVKGDNTISGDAEEPAGPPGG
jgi:hypothetical protein